MSELIPHIIKKTNGNSYLDIDDQEYALGSYDDVELDGREIPPIKMDRIPEDVSFTLWYKYMMLSVPIYFLETTNVGIALQEEVGRPFKNYDGDPFFDYWGESPLFVEKCFDDLNYIDWVAMAISGDTLVDVFATLKTMVDELWSRYPAVYEQLKKEGYEPME